MAIGWSRGPLLAVDARIDMIQSSNINSTGYAGDLQSSLGDAASAAASTAADSLEDATNKSEKPEADIHTNFISHK